MSEAAKGEGRVELWRIKQMRATGEPGDWKPGEPNPNEHTEVETFIRATLVEEVVEELRVGMARTGARWDGPERAEREATRQAKQAILDRLTALLEGGEE